MSTFDAFPAPAGSDTSASDLGRELGQAIARGLNALTWARREDQLPRLDPQSGLYEDDLLIEALVSAIGSIPGVRQLG